MSEESAPMYSPRPPCRGYINKVLQTPNGVLVVTDFCVYRLVVKQDNWHQFEPIAFCDEVTA